MTENTATDMVDSRTRMLPPLVVFGVACFLFAGALKFNLKGGDIWFVRPMGAPVTCLFIAAIGWVAARWFFGFPPSAIRNKLLATAVVLLPLMGLLGVIQGATHPAGSEDRTMLGGTLGSMLAGPRAFGSLGTTIAGIVFTILALLGGYLARRITTPETPASADDPYAALKAMSAAKRPPVIESADHAVAVAEEEPAKAEPKRHGDLFPADVELEPEATEIEPIEPARPMGGAARRLAAEPEQKPAPARAPILSGLVSAADEADEAPTAAALFAGSLLREPEAAGLAPVATLTLDDEPTAAAPKIPQERESRSLPHPTLDPDEDVIADADDDTDEDAEVEARVIATIEESNDAIDSEPAGESPELAREWLAAPAVFHMPRRIHDEIASNESLMDILDVEDAEPEVTEAEAEAPAEAEPVVERPRFRIKADYVRHETQEEPEAEPEPILSGAAVEEEEEEQDVMVVEEEAVAEPPPLLSIEIEPEPEPAQEEDAAEPVAAEAPAPEVEAQLEFPAEAPATPEEAGDEAPASRPRRRMRSAAKDWASWDEAPNERPRLRLVKSEEPETEQLEVPMAAEGDDPYDRAVKVVVAEDRCSVSLLQRNLGVTFGEATALIDRMYQQGVVGPYQPTGRRDVLLGKKKKSKAAEEG